MSRERLARNTIKLSYYFPKGEIYIKQEDVDSYNKQELKYSYIITTFKSRIHILGDFTIDANSSTKELDDKVCNIMQKKVK